MVRLRANRQPRGVPFLQPVNACPSAGTSLPPAGRENQRDDIRLAEAPFRSLPTPQPADRLERALFTLAVAAFLAYAAFFIYRTSFVVAGERYFSLFDDAMVSMRYAMNFAEGHGLVWNPGGERVEGYTNPLWVLYMSLVHLLPIPQSKTSLFVQIIAALLLALNLYYVRRIALAVANGSGTVALGAVVLTASYLPINNWSLQGMEVSVLVLLTTICVWLAIQNMETGTFQRRLYLLLGIGTLIRPDMVVPLAAFLSFMLVAEPIHRRRHLACGLLAVAVPVAGQTLLRAWYYGDLLPNTFYLKLTGVPLFVRISRGVYTLLRFVWKANPLFFVMALTLALRRDRRFWLLIWILAAQMAYSVYVGGDAWESWGGSNRYISIAMPGFFILLSYALYMLTSALTNVLLSGIPMSMSGTRTAPVVLFALAISYAVVTVNSIYGLGALAEAALIRPPLHTGSGGENQEDVEQALLVRRVTTADATVAVMRAGTIPYFAGRHTFDLLGKNDRHVAHMPVRTSSGTVNFLEFRPGHMKFDFAYSIGQQRPDVIFQLRRRTDAALPFLRDDYQDMSVAGNCIYVRRASSNVLWGQLPSDGCDRIQDQASR
jgi:arabinofuranosyltransferase